MKSGAYGADLASDQACDVLVGRIVHKTEQQDFAMLGGQLVQRGENPFCRSFCIVVVIVGLLKAPQARIRPQLGNAAPALAREVVPGCRSFQPFVPVWIDRLY